MNSVVSHQFIMHGAHAAMAGGLSHIGEQVRAIELAVDENPGLAFDLAKTLVESVCRTVLKERNIPSEPGDDLPKLFKQVTTHVSFLPPTASSEADVRKSLSQTLSGLHTAIQGICELRNQCGFASHGSSDARPAMESVQALLAAEAADTIVGFLYRVHRQQTISPLSSVNYKNQQEFNAYIDDVHGIVTIFRSEFRPSEVLFQMEPETYRVALSEFDGKEESGDQAEVPEGKA